MNNHRLVRVKEQHRPGGVRCCAQGGSVVRSFHCSLRSQLSSSLKSQGLKERGIFALRLAPCALCLISIRNPQSEIRNPKLSKCLVLSP
jgi:hypothetical protein